MTKINVLGINIDLWSLAESVVLITESIAGGKKLRIVTANPELIYKARKQKELQDIINSADLVLPDGIGVVWALKQLGCTAAERVTGIDLTEYLLQEGSRRGWRVFLLGARPGVAEKAVARQATKYPGLIFCCQHGFFPAEEEPSVLERIRRFAPDLLLVGLGAPRQEFFNAAHQGIAGASIGVGGTIDVLAGEVKRAPAFFRRSNLEWFYRLVTQPSRIRRQAVLPLYVLKVLRQKYLK
ncbi:MAG: WecB/TagA/CpsF family glycosyltransferase [Desulfitobacteriia bacterium]|jgi:N-acetylglucosaminyldiphosphoundecaprenol N-acetyl-beta-D-mannosaminyltransferase